MLSSKVLFSVFLEKIKIRKIEKPINPKINSAINDIESLNRSYVKTSTILNELYDQKKKAQQSYDEMQEFNEKFSKFISNVKTTDTELAKKHFQNRFIEYHMEFFKSCLTKIIKMCIENGCQETPEDMFEIINSEYQGREDFFSKSAE